MNSAAPTIVEFTHGHLFCGVGGGAKGYNRGHARVGSLEAKFRCVGGIDVDPGAVAAFSRVAGVEGTVLDLFDRDQYIAFWGHEPPEGWREATVDDIRRAMHGERPNIWFLSAPCKGFSGLLPEASSKTDKYQALNRLTLRGVWLALEAFKDDPAELFVFENVPRIAIRGRHLLDQIAALFRAYGYVIAETTHDCGELAGLAQSRKRFLLVARHAAKVPPFLYEPEKKRLRGVGEVLERLPLPGDPAGGQMHRMPALQWKTWVRLAFVEAGSDWRSLSKYRCENGYLADFGIVPDAAWHKGVLGVRRWTDTTGVVAGESSPTNGAFAVADPTFFSGGGKDGYQQYGVRRWRDATSAVINVKSPGQGPHSVADPRPSGPPHFNNVYRIVRWGEAAGAVTAGQGPSSGGQAVADPRMDWNENAHGSKLAVQGWEDPARTIGGARFGSGGGAVADPRPPARDDYKATKYRVTSMDEPAGAVIAASTTGNGAFAVADPRTGLDPGRTSYRTEAHYGVQRWDQTSRAVPGFAKVANGPFSVADPRDQSSNPLGLTDGLNPPVSLPAGDQRLVAVIRALDGTWHRPFTTLELAALQSFVDPDDPSDFWLPGQSDSAWREWIGNAVPPQAAEAIAGVMGTTLLLAMSGETFTLSSQPIWVRPVALALSIDQTPNEGLLD